MPERALDPLAPVLALLLDDIASAAWRKCIVTPPRGDTRRPWQKLVAQPVALARGPAIKLVTTASGRETTRTLTPDEWRSTLVPALEAGPCNLDVLANDHDWHARRTKAGRWLVTRAKSSLPVSSPSLAPHDRDHHRQLDPADPPVLRFLVETGLFSKSGKVLGESADKYRQVQHYLELLRPLSVWEQPGSVRIVDAGCGKAYLSLGLLLWAERRGIEASLTGVDNSAEVIATVQRIAANCGLDSATFEPSTITAYSHKAPPADLLVSLHACDTATDEALAAGVRLGAKAIVLVPCCHNELSDQIEANLKAGFLSGSHPWSPALKFGLTRRRLADVITDSLRAAALEALGYKVDVIDFTTPDITARNLMIRAEKRPDPGTSAGQALANYRALASEWQVKPALEELLGDLWPPLATTAPR